MHGATIKITSCSVSVCTPIMPFELSSAHVCCTGLKHLTSLWALYCCCRISYCCENLCWSLSIQEQCEFVFSYEARTAALISIPFITYYKHSGAQYNRGSPFHKKYALTLQFQHIAKLMVKGCTRKVSDSNPRPPRGFNGCRVFPAEECLDVICKIPWPTASTVLLCTIPSLIARLPALIHLIVKALFDFCPRYGLTLFDLKTSGYYMYRYI